jgi:SAM-dependent methyltransferase
MVGNSAEQGVTRARSGKEVAPGNYAAVMDLDPDADAHRLSSAAFAAGDSTGWFEALYSEARDGTANVPWDRGAPNGLLVEWAEAKAPAASGRSALVVGCGPGRDSEYLAGLGYRVTAFDISPTAVAMARERHPDSPVDYVVADLLAAPGAWSGAFDLVLESYNVQALPATVRPAAIAAVAPLVAPGGTLLVFAFGPGRDDTPAAEGPPWPLTRAEVEALGAGLDPVRIEHLLDADDPAVGRWQAEFRRS